MASIILTSSPADLGLDGPRFAVVAKSYEPPVGVPAVDVEDIVADPAPFFAEPATMVVVGMSRLLNPTNRVRLGQALLRPRPGITRICIDKHLFVVDPWRMFWQFFSVQHNPWGYTDSFLAQSRWERAFAERDDDPFGTEPVLAAMRGAVDVREDAFRFPAVDVEEVPRDAATHRAYALEKEAAFTHEKTFAAIKRRLVAFAKEALPRRSIPTKAHIFKRPPLRIVHSDLGVDRFLVSELMSRIELTNAIAGARP